MNTVQGVVKKILERQWGGKTFYSIALLERDELFGMGAKRPKCKQGDVISFETEQNDKGYWDVKGEIQQHEQKGNATLPVGDNRQDTILFQSSRKDALVFIDLLVKTESYPLPTKKDARMEALESLLVSLTERFYWNGKNLPKTKPEDEVPATLFDSAEA